MKWHLYRRDDPNTWPQIDCPMLVYGGVPFYRDMPDIVTWDNVSKKFMWNKDRALSFKECYYAYIGYVPCKYKIHTVLKCMDDSDCKIGCADNGYCMYDHCECEQQKEVNEYSITEKAIWKEWEE